MTITPEVLQDELTVVSATARFDFLTRREAMTPTQNVADEDDFWFQVDAVGAGLDRSESLELIALGEVIARKVQDSQPVAVQSALRAGATWDEIGAAAAVPAALAWDEYDAWIDGQLRAHRQGRRALDPTAAAAARRLAGPRPA